MYLCFFCLALFWFLQDASKKVNFLPHRFGLCSHCCLQSEIGGGGGVVDTHTELIST